MIITIPNIENLSFVKPPLELNEEQTALMARAEKACQVARVTLKHSEQLQTIYQQMRE